MEKEEDCTASFCLSFSSYTVDKIAETAERVRLELSDESNGCDHWDEDFEFVNHNNLRLNSEPVSSFPIFQQILAAENSAVEAAAVKTKLRDLFQLDPSSYPSSSSSSDEEEEEEGVTYCGKGGWRKSKSTGSSSRRWRIKDMLLRSYSEGKQSSSRKFMSTRNREEEEESSKKKKEKRESAHEKLYLRNKAVKEEEKRKSYLPYKKHLFGFFFTVHGSRK